MNHSTLSYSKVSLISLLMASLLLLQGCAQDNSAHQNGLTEELPTSSAQVDTQAQVVEANSRSQISISDSIEPDEPFVAAWQLDSALSELRWSSARLINKDNPHTGVVPITEGALNQGKTQGNFVFNMAELTSENERVTEHLKSPDFFEVETYPFSTFNIYSIQDLPSGQKQITGDLTIKDVTEELIFETLDWSEENGILTAEAAFKVDRLKWGIEFDSGSIFKGLGERAIADEIDYELKVVLNQINPDQPAE